MQECIPCLTVNNNPIYPSVRSSSPLSVDPVLSHIAAFFYIYFPTFPTLTVFLLDAMKFFFISIQNELGLFPGHFLTSMSTYQYTYTTPETLTVAYLHSQHHFLTIFQWQAPH